ncbi:major facilitator superfamily domain-containing protein [Talaromyces proteolyticus]|uniref:Major facilitator superfamily domain-containing protein n=1 Tax=Talaromyces proteolyticus TaxID=1131652 RepID=A0AAD4Q247_9EURO|nr:major facilitator superfamily domain-containing protein [Talaromyces proteolyticus]KAH8699238.1 major facilitator superfamily domain-containing protein [Talaromyces proteolyticus]
MRGFRFRRTGIPEAVEPPIEATAEENTAAESKLEFDDSNSIDRNAQHGVRSAQAVIQVWTRNQLFLPMLSMTLLYPSDDIWFIEFILAYSSGVTGTLIPYVTSSFEAHSLTALASLIDIWGRPQGFALVVSCMTLGFIMMTACNNVKIYCAAQVFYLTGYNCIDFCLTILITETTSSLRNRALVIAFTASPWIATVWVYGPTAQCILATMGFRWSFCIWAIVVPVVCSPLFGLFYYNRRKAEKAGILSATPSGRTFTESPHEWKSPLIICFIIFGGLLIISFALYERYLAPVTFIPWALLNGRTVFFTFTMIASLYTAWYIWDTYFYSLLVVVFDQSVTHATYIQNIYTVGSTFWSLIMGVIIHYNGRLKWQVLYFGVPNTILGVCLMIKFRLLDINIGYIIMCQIFVAFGGGTLVICEQMTVMSVTTQALIPSILSMEGMMSSIGNAVGFTIAEATWSKKLEDLSKIYESITVQSSYPVGSQARDAINHAYVDTQKLMLIAATCLYSITLISVLLRKDINVKNIKQTQGLIF